MKLPIRFLSFLALLAAFGVGEAVADQYMLMQNPPDVDKWAFHDTNNDGKPDSNDLSCWMAAAANMLGGAGYGSAGTIYQKMYTEYADYRTAGTIANALSWYLQKYPDPNNLYRLVNVYDGGLWNAKWTPQFIASQLEAKHFVGIGIWPDTGATQVGHALTAWGWDVSPTTSLFVTDSDRDQSGIDINSYNWTRYADAAGAGKDLWAIDYYSPGYLEYIVTLTPIPEPAAILLLATMLVAISRTALRNRAGKRSSENACDPTRAALVNRG